MPGFVGISFNDFDDETRPPGEPVSALQFGVYDKAGNLIGITVKLASMPVMMLRVEPIPDDAVSFTGDR